MKFEQLTVWQRESNLACQVYQAQQNNKDFGFKDQITRSALSIPSNIAEGEERETAKESARFFYYAKGSAGELVTQLYIGIKIGYVNKYEGFRLISETKQIANMLGKLIQIRKKLASNQEIKHIHCLLNVTKYFLKKLTG